MAGQFSNNLMEDVLKHFFLNDATTITPSTNIALTLTETGNTDPTASAAGTASGAFSTETVADGFNASVDTETGGFSIDNNAAIDILATGSISANITHVNLFAGSVTANNYLGYAELDTAISGVTTGDTVQFAAGALNIQITSTNP